MTGETVLQNIWHVMRGHQAEHYGKKPLFVYISYKELYFLKNTEEFLNENAPSHPFDEEKPLRIFGMEIVKVSKETEFIRVGN